MNGTLSEGVLPRVMRELYVGRKTGTLHLEEGEVRSSLRFHRGTIINAHTTLLEDRLGELLVRRGVVSQSDFDRATEVVIAQKKRIGQVFLELGVLDGEGLEDAISLHVREILTKVLAWSEGRYTFDETPERPVDEELTLKLSTGELILEAVRAIQDPDVVRYALGDIDRPLALSSDPLLRFQKLTLSPTDGFVLSRVDGTLSAREVMTLIPLPAEDTQRSLFGLLCTGIIEVLTEGQPGRSPAPAPAAAPVKPPPPPPAPPPPVAAPAVTAPAPPAPSPPTPPAPPYAPPRPPTPPPAFVPPPPEPAPTPPAPRAPSAPPADPAVAARRQEILDTYAGLKTKTHFEMLGIARASTEAQVKEVYFRLAKRFHPDVHHDPSLGDLRDRLEAVFIRLGEAYETLRNARTRAAYEERLGASAPRPAGGSVAEAPAAAPPRIDPEAEVRAAEAQVRHAEKHYEKEKYWDAIQAVEPAIPVLTGKMRQRARVLLARAYLKNPKWVKRAEETLLSVIHDDDKNVDGHFLLGRIYKEQGLRTRSLSMFRRVVELKPDHEEAAAELAEVPAEPEPPSGGGFIRKLFGKKG